MPKFIVERHVAYVTEVDADTLEDAIDFVESLPTFHFDDAGLIRESIIAEEDIGKPPIITYETEYH